MTLVFNLSKKGVKFIIGAVFYSVELRGGGGIAQLIVILKDYLLPILCSG